MRVLWITSDIFSSITTLVKGNYTTGRPWIEPLFNNIVRHKDIQIATLTPVVDGKFQELYINDSPHYVIPIKKNDTTSHIDTKLAEKYLTIINKLSPDIIHVHGTEINFGLLRKYVNKDIPIVCSIQGIIPPCYHFLKQSVANINYKKYRSIKNILGRGGVDGALRKWKKYSPIEKEVFQVNQYFIGRTQWDMAYVTAYNPESKYFHGEEILRRQFYSTNWDINQCERHRIFISSSAYALKGFHVLLKAVGILKSKYPNIKIITPLSSVKEDRSRIADFLLSEDYNNYIKKEIKNQKLENNIELKQSLTAAQMAEEFKKAHVFVLPSFLENSPNSLGEAMLIGTPTVVSPVGGVLSIVQDESSTLAFSTDDHVMMAHQIDRFFTNDDLAVKISSNAKAIAKARHNIENTVNQYINIYTSIINSHRRNKVQF